MYVGRGGEIIFSITKTLIAHEPKEASLNNSMQVVAGGGNHMVPFPL